VYYLVGQRTETREEKRKHTVTAKKLGIREKVVARNANKIGPRAHDTIFDKYRR